jgi:hypothetical protein
MPNKLNRKGIVTYVGHRKSLGFGFGLGSCLIFLFYIFDHVYLVA